ncbi:hypothetical protein DRO21_07080 [archaeon]|nr:MAG: hypothetical protein DRO21_07080 [archaeon]
MWVFKKVKGKRFQIVIWDVERKEKREKPYAKSFTVYGDIELEELYNKLVEFVTKLNDNSKKT